MGIAANFLCDNSSYILGVDGKGKPQRTLDCFAACTALHEQLLETADSPAARAVLAFFRNWAPEKASEHPVLREHLQDIQAGGNLIFRCDGAFIHDDPAIRRAWQAHYDAAGDGPQMACLVTGRVGPAVQLHPSIKGVAGAQSSGASLVSFNAPAFCSYGHEQGQNAPTGEYAAFAYGAALNYLLSQRDKTFRIGDTTVVTWAEGGAPEYPAFFGSALVTIRPRRVIKRRRKVKMSEPIKTAMSL